MSKDIITMNTVEDMVAKVLGNTHWGKIKFQLHDSTDEVYNDPESGQAWEMEFSAWVETLGLDERGYKRYAFSDLIPEEEAERKLLVARRPEKHPESRYYLYESGGRWSNQVIDLSPELGAMVEDIWTMRPMFRGSSMTKRVGMMTLPGILKRLGLNGLDAQIAEAKKVEELKEDKNRRNSNRRYLRKISQEYLDGFEAAGWINKMGLTDSAQEVKDAVAKFVESLGQDEEV